MLCSSRGFDKLSLSGTLKGMAHHHTHNHDHQPQHHAHQTEHRAHANDQGLAGLLRYLTVLPRMWHSPVSSAVVRMVAPARGETVLEIGAGMGPAAVVAAKTGAHVVAVDPTPYMRNILLVRSLAHGGAARISVADGAAEHLPAADESIDAVWTVNTMHHWGDLRQALHEIRRVLTPGGRLVLVDEDFENPAHPAHKQAMRRRHRHAHAFTEIRPAELAEQLVAGGFTAAEGIQDWIAGRPAKIVRGTK
jgi:SAM-dependent methyltransferase